MVSSQRQLLYVSAFTLALELIILRLLPNSVISWPPTGLSERPPTGPFRLSLTEREKIPTTKSAPSVRGGGDGTTQLQKNGYSSDNSIGETFQPLSPYGELDSLSVKPIISPENKAPSDHIKEDPQPIDRRIKEQDSQTRKEKRIGEIESARLHIFQELRNQEKDSFFFAKRNITITSSSIPESLTIQDLNEILRAMRNWSKE